MKKEEKDNRQGCTCNAYCYTVCLLSFSSFFLQLFSLHWVKHITLPSLVSIILYQSYRNMHIYRLFNDVLQLRRLELNGAIWSEKFMEALVFTYVGTSIKNFKHKTLLKKPTKCTSLSLLLCINRPLNMFRFYVKPSSGDQKTTDTHYFTGNNY
jgi:hypothetical protein